MVLTKNSNIVTWDVDNTRIATFDASSFTLGGNNIALGESDANSTTTRHPSLVFTVFDNLVVTSIPEPSCIALVAASMACSGWATRPRSRRA